MPKGKKEKIEDLFESEEEGEQTWDKKKIIAGVALFLLLIGSIIGLKQFVLPKSIAQHIPIGPAVKGAETQAGDAAMSTATPTPEKITLPTADDLQKKIQELQAQLTHVNPRDIASSSPQVQQLIQQLQALPQAPVNAAKEACIQVCNKL